jgi:hypothetical protein
MGKTDSANFFATFMHAFSINQSINPIWSYEKYQMRHRPGRSKARIEQSILEDKRDLDFECPIIVLNS